MACFVAGCASSAPSEPAVTTPVTDAASASCGFSVGQRLCDLPLSGHLRDAATGLATTVPTSTFTFSDVFAKGTQKYAFIHTSAYW